MLEKLPFWLTLYDIYDKILVNIDWPFYEQGLYYAKHIKNGFFKVSNRQFSGLTRQVLRSRGLGHMHQMTKNNNPPKIRGGRGVELRMMYNVWKITV